MTWQDRLREAAYTSPNGTRLAFTFENVSRTVDRKTTAFDFPDAVGTYVQDLGHSGYQYPLRLFFWGDDYDTEVAAFEAALLEPGVGRLEHPAYGAVDVVPFGTIRRRDDLKSAGNQAVLEVVFWETIGVIYPTGQRDPGVSVLSAVEEFNEAAAEQAEEGWSLSKAVEQASLKADIEGFIADTKDFLQPIADTVDDVRQAFDTVEQSINEGIDTLIGEPLTLAFQITQLVQAPARAVAQIKDRLSAYGDLADSIISGDGAEVSPGFDQTAPNEFQARDLFAMAYVSGSVVSVVNSQFTTKAEALQAAADVLDQFDTVVAWRDLNYDILENNTPDSLDAVRDTGEAYQRLQEAVALTAGFLVEISFTLKQERRLVLDRARTVVDLSAELYGEIDNQLDFLIASNELTGSEILELPRGREVVYYV